MSSWMNNLRAFGRQAPRGTQNQAPSRTNTSSPSAYSPSSLSPPPAQAPPASPSLTATMAGNETTQQQQVQPPPREPFFFREKYSGLMAKGNFMTIAAKPQQVEDAEWLAHQMVEQARLLNGMLKIVQEVDRHTGRAHCSEESCPKMSAGPTTYTWIDTNRQPINLPATTYIRHIQTWVNGKILDQSLFPTDNFSSAPKIPTEQEAQADPQYWLGKTSGFPQRFDTEIKNMYKQMFRCYAHLYWSHWLMFWDFSSTRDLNTCFVHFLNVGRLFNLLSNRDMEPMAPLIDMWVKQGVMPKIEVVDTPQPGTAS